MTPESVDPQWFVNNHLLGWLSTISEYFVVSKQTFYVFYVQNRKITFWKVCEWYMLIEKEVGDIEHCKAHKFQPTNTFSMHILMSRLFFIWMQIYVLFKYGIMCLPLIISFHLTIYCGHLFPLTNPQCLFASPLYHELSISCFIVLSFP